MSQNSIEIHPEFLAIWHTAIGSIMQQMRTNTGLYKVMKITDDEIVVVPDGTVELQTSVNGNLIKMAVPVGMWKTKGSDIVWPTILATNELRVITI